MTLAFLRRYPTPAQAERLTARSLGRFLTRQGYTGSDGARSPHQPERAHAGTPNGGVDIARAWAMLGRVLDEYEAAIAGVLQRHPDAALFSSFPGTGLVTTATLLAEIGEDRTHFPSPGSLVAEAGLAPVTRPGSSRRVGFRYAANHHLRAVWGQWMVWRCWLDLQTYDPTLDRRALIPA